jgi:iron(II)-dependent oxidoreductase
MTGREPLDASELRACLRDARARTLALLADLDGAQLLGPELEIVNPPLWELGHVGWFQEQWCLRQLRGRAPLRADADVFWDSAAIAHPLRWRLAFPPPDETRAYVAGVLAEVERALADPLDARERELHLLALYHEDMHGEAFVYTRLTLGYAPPPGSAPHVAGGGAWPGDVAVPGCTWELGARRDAGFTFDNERWAHPVEVAPFRIARAPVTQAEFRAFVADGGYARRALWSAEGWEWREREQAEHPLHWHRAENGDWMRRRFDRLVALEPDLPVHCVSAHEAEAWCRWAGRRLPMEAEWECAAGRARFPWGDAPPAHMNAQLDLAAYEPCAVGAHAAGDSPHGLRQMIGNVWEWTASEFRPYPGFAPGDYREYSEPWFHGHRVLRGGCFATRARLLRRTYRNFYPPERRDVLAGFRTCALDA